MRLPVSGAVMLQAAVIGMLANHAVLGAQTLRGTVVESATGQPISGVVLALVDSAGAEVRHGISDVTGTYAIAAPREGSYRLSARRIGFRPTTSDPVSVIIGLNEIPPLRLTGIAISLDTVRVASRDVCGGRPDAGFAAIWDQARTALQAAQLTAASRGLTARVVTYERALHPRLRRVERQSAEVATGFVTQPWRTAPPATLRRRGYVVTDDNGWVTYHAPGIGVLASDAFVEDHCFRVQRPRDGRIAIDFQPTRERRDIPEIRGTIWLDATTAHLRRLEYGYTNVSDAQENQAGGDIEFARLSDGGWAITRWSIRMPVLEQVVMQGRPTLRMTEIREAGGDLSLAMRGTDTLWARDAVVLAGTVLDSVTGAPIVGARLAFRGTPVATESGERGAWRMEQLLPGEYIVEVRTPRLDSIGAVHVAPLLVTASTSDVEIRVGRPRPRYARFVGTVRDSSGGPIPEAAVSLADLNLSTYTDSAGRFELGQVPPGDHHVSVRRVGFGPVDVRVGFPAERVVERQVVLLSVQTLDVVTTTARSIIPGFDEHRAQGLGQFLTREDLERQSGRRLADVLAQFRGVRIATVNGRQHITARRRQEMAFNRNDVGRNDPRLVPVESQCPATIYINGALAYERRVNTTPPNLADFTPDQIEAIEYYESETQVPVRYMRADARCGVLVIHTRRARQERAPAPKDKPGRR